MTDSTGSISDLKGLFSKKFGMDEFDDVLHQAIFDRDLSETFFTEDIVLDGDFTISLQTKNLPDVVVGSLDTMVLLGNKDNTQPVISVRENLSVPSLRVRTATTARDINIDNENGLFRFSRVNGQLTVWKDGIQIDQGSLPGDLILNSLGLYASSAFKLVGSMYGVEIWKDGDEYTGTKIVDLPMHEYKKDHNGDIFFYNKVASPDSRFSLQMGDDTTVVRGSFPLISIGKFEEFEVEFDITPAQFDNEVLMGYSQSANPAILLLTGSYLRTRASTGSTFNTGVAAGEIYRPNERVVVSSRRNADNTITVSVNGVDVETSLNQIAGEIFWDTLGTYSAHGYAYTGQYHRVRIWKGGDRNTGSLVMDLRCDDNSKILVNHAVPLGEEAWDYESSNTYSSGDGSVTKLGNGQYRLQCNTGYCETTSNVLGDLSNTDVLLELTVYQGDIQTLITGNSAVDFTGWESVRDSKGQPIEGRYRTLVNRSSGAAVLIKRVTACDIIIGDITAKEATGYGVLEGIRDTDYEWKHDGYHAIGYNLTTEER